MNFHKKRLYHLKYGFFWCSHIMRRHKLSTSNPVQISTRAGLPQNKRYFCVITHKMCDDGIPVRSYRSQNYNESGEFPKNGSHKIRKSSEKQPEKGRPLF